MATQKPTEKQVFANQDEQLAALKSEGRSLNKKFGIEGITMASDLKPWKRAAFGIPELDAVIGGGIPHGLFTCIWGGPGSGKTTAAMKLVAQAQKEGKVAYWIALEALDVARAEQFGVDLDRLAIGQFPQAEQALDSIVSVARKGLASIIVLDSIHSLAPKGMQENSKGEKSLSDETMAILARKLSEFFKIASDPIKRAEIAVLLIGQTRMQVGFITIEALTGGNALHHGCKLIIRNRRGAKDDAPREKIKNGDKTEEVIVGFPGVFKLEKVQVPNAKTEGTVVQVPYYFETGYDKPSLATQNPHATDPEALLKAVNSSTKIENPDFKELKPKAKRTKKA